MKRLFIGLLLTAATCCPATAATTAREHSGWKIPQHFDMSVAGFQGTYQPGEQIVLQVEGMSKLLEAGPSAGFKVKAKLYDFPSVMPRVLPLILISFFPRTFRLFPDTFP